MRFFVETIGCQMNVCESRVLIEGFLSLGLERADNPQDADIVVLNTCSVRAQAEQKAFSFLGRMEEMKKEGKVFKIIVMGCMAQRISERLRVRFKSIDLIVGTDDLAVRGVLGFVGGERREGKRPFGAEQTLRGPTTLRNPLRDGQARPLQKPSCFIVARQRLARAPFGKPPRQTAKGGLTSPPRRGNASQSVLASHYVTVMKGCDNFCSYCIVPFVRGRERSVDIEDILRECIKAAENGAKEIVLLGQNVNSYSFKGINFSHLIKRIAEIDDILRIRFMTNHPKDLSDDLIATIAAEDKVCKHIHLPMQSASDKILLAMNRKYDFKHYQHLIEKIRKNIPQISITTDIIVGFPSETQEDFELTFEAVRAIEFSALFVFRYSPRPQTQAAQMPDDIPLDEKQRRLSLILELGNEISMRYVSNMKGGIYDVLFEKFQDGLLEGKTQGCRKVIVKGGSVDNLGTVGRVLIKETRINALFGDILTINGA